MLEELTINEKIIIITADGIRHEALKAFFNSKKNVLNFF